MYVLELMFTRRGRLEEESSGTSPSPADAAEEAIDFLLGSWRKNGQILGHEFPIARVDGGWRVFVRAPAADALDEGHDNVYAREERVRWTAEALGTMEVRLLGWDASSVPECPGHGDSDLIFYTDFVSVDSPLRCAECFGTVPAYTLPPRFDQEHLDLIAWQGDYRACDRLQMGCATGEDFALHEMGDLESSLSQRGLEICAGIRETTGRRAWYYLYRYYGADPESERERRCPRCGGEWLLAERWHQWFDFRCDRCGLLSNLAQVYESDDDGTAVDTDGAAAAR